MSATASEWSGTQLAAFAVYRTGDVSNSVFVKAKIGYVLNRIEFGGVTEDSHDLAFGLGLGLAAGHVGFEFDSTITVNGSLIGDDELAFLSLNVLYLF